MFPAVVWVRSRREKFLAAAENQTVISQLSSLQPNRYTKCSPGSPWGGVLLLLGCRAVGHDCENRNVDTATMSQTLIILSVVCCFTAQAITDCAYKRRM
jgi:hypothetical protein